MRILLLLTQKTPELEEPVKYPKHIKHRGRVLASIYGKGKYPLYRVAWTVADKRMMKAFDRYGEAKRHADIRVHNGSVADKPDYYANKSAEIWYEGRTQIERQRIILPNDKLLFMQLTARRGWPNGKGSLELESKEDLRKRNLGSPDRADAVLGTMLPPQVFHIFVA